MRYSKQVVIFCETCEGVTTHRFVNKEARREYLFDFNGNTKPRLETLPMPTGQLLLAHIYECLGCETPRVFGNERIAEPKAEVALPEIRPSEVELRG